MTQKISAKEIILERGLKPKKSFGQNFMLDQQVNSIFAGALAGLGHNLRVIEIGAGTGSLTRHLLKFAEVVHAVERDRDLIPILSAEFEDAIAEKKLVLHEADGARFDLSSLFSVDKPGVLAGNLPYHLTSSILFLALRHIECLQGAVFLVQKEVADRLAASPNTKQYGFLTVVLKLVFKIERVAIVNRNAFWPIPKVDSAIIQLARLENGSKISDLEKFIVFVRETFQQRRKKLSTILRNKLNTDQFLRAQIDPNLRPENLTPEQFLVLFNEQQNPAHKSP